MIRCDQDNVPCIVQDFFYDVTKGWYDVKLFNGGYTYVSDSNIGRSKHHEHEIFGMLENYFRNNLHLIKMENKS